MGVSVCDSIAFPVQEIELAVLLFGRLSAHTRPDRRKHTHKQCFFCFCAVTVMLIAWSAISSMVTQLKLEWTGAINPRLCLAAFDYQVSVNVTP